MKKKTYREDEELLEPLNKSVTGNMMYKKFLSLDAEIKEYEDLLKALRKPSREFTTDWENYISKDEREVVKFNYSRLLELRANRDRILGRTYYYTDISKEE